MSKKRRPPKRSPIVRQQPPDARRQHLALAIARDDRPTDAESIAAQEARDLAWAEHLADGLVELPPEDRAAELLAVFGAFLLGGACPCHRCTVIEATG